MCINDKLHKIVHVLDDYLGDSDPQLEDDMTDEDIKQEYPIFWATKELFSILETHIQQSKT